MNKNSPTVSVCMPTYNHQEFIAHAIEGVLLQRTAFPIELRIGDDCSTDKTVEICREYRDRYPDIIKLRLNAKNQGQMMNWVASLRSCKGKYIAMCEGDDFWIDPFKLQKQVAILETHPEYSLAFHNAFMIFVDERDRVGAYRIPPQEDFNTKDLLEYAWFVPTASIVFRRAALPPSFPEWYYDTHQGDYALLIMLSRSGPLHLINEFMSVYRIGGESSLTRKVAFKFVHYQNKRIRLLEQLDGYLNNEYTVEIGKAIRELRSATVRYRIKQALKKVGIDLYKR